MSTPQTATCITFHVYAASFATQKQRVGAGLAVPCDLSYQAHLLWHQLLFMFHRCLLTVDHYHMSFNHHEPSGSQPFDSNICPFKNYFHVYSAGARLFCWAHDAPGGAAGSVWCTGPNKNTESWWSGRSDHLISFKTESPRPASDDAARQKPSGCF